MTSTVVPRPGFLRAARSGLTQAAEVRRRPRPAGPPRSIPPAASLLAADLVAVGCPGDGRCHLVDESHFAAELVAASREPDIHALCDCRLIPDSLLVAARPACPGCLRAAEPLICDALGVPAPPVRRRMSSRNAVRARLAAALARLRDALDPPVSTGRHAVAGGPPCP